MIPKTIHYCWFGGNPKPKLVEKCIKSWKKYCPDYEIKEWNETNYDLNACNYVKEAHASKKYAFVSDYARLDILYRYGGIYFDTDVELIKPIDAIVEQGAFMGVEDIITNTQRNKITVNPGVGLAAEAGMPIYKELLDFYNTLHFIKSDASLNLETIVSYTTKILLNHGLKICTDIQKIAGITIYPKEYFNPCDMRTKNIVISEKTLSIHHFAGSWLGKKEKFKRLVRKIVGNRIYLFLYSLRRGKNEK